MTRDEAIDTIAQCMALMDSIEALLLKARKALELAGYEMDVEFTPEFELYEDKRPIPDNVTEFRVKRVWPDES